MNEWMNECLFAENRNNDKIVQSTQWAGQQSSKNGTNSTVNLDNTNKLYSMILTSAHVTYTNQKKIKRRNNIGNKITTIEQWKW